MFISSSTIYTSGSSKFGDTPDDKHSFTGSLQVIHSGSLTHTSSVEPAPNFFVGEYASNGQAGGFNVYKNGWQRTRVGIGHPDPGNNVGGVWNAHQEAQPVRSILRSK